MARPQIYRDDTWVRVSPSGASKLQKESDRRAIVDTIIENGGRMRMDAIDLHFGVSMRQKVAALIRVEWLITCDPPEGETE